VSDEYVYITATDPAGRKDQAVFRLQIGGIDGGSDIGDPHIHTTDGKSYDFQAAGEFTLLRDRDGMEIQTRQNARADAASGHRPQHWSDRMREPEHRRCSPRGFAPNLLPAR